MDQAFLAPKKVLVVSTSTEVLAATTECADLLGWHVHHVTDDRQAMLILRQEPPDTIEALILELEEIPLTMFRRDISNRSSGLSSTGSSSSMNNPTSNDNNGNESCLLKYACHTVPAMLRIVYSHTAQSIHALRHDYFKRGADAVVDSSEQLWDALWGLLTAPDALSYDDREMLAKKQYGPLHQRQLRFKQLVSIASGERTVRSNKIVRITEQTEHQMYYIPRIFTNFWQVSCRCNHQESHKPHNVRIVQVSDTNGKHRQLDIPKGDLFLFAGNICDPRQYDAFYQLNDFLEWLGDVVSPNFEQVVFIAGANDILLDNENHPEPQVCMEACGLLHYFLSKHSNVTYLEDSSITFRDLVIYGSPTVLKNERHANAAFERELQEYCDENGGTIRPHEDRVDILLTNRPPSKTSGLDGFEDTEYTLPTDSLYQDQSNVCKNVCKKGTSLRDLFHLGSKQPVKHAGPPRLHAIGHGTKMIGMLYNEKSKTLLINASQERLIQADRHGGGTPLVIQLPPVSAEEENSKEASHGSVALRRRQLAASREFSFDTPSIEMLLSQERSKIIRPDRRGRPRIFELATRSANIDWPGLSELPEIIPTSSSSETIGTEDVPEYQYIEADCTPASIPVEANNDFEQRRGIDEWAGSSTGRASF